MSHHGQDYGRDLDPKLRKLFDSELGKTGDFPGGKLRPDDEGGVTFAVGTEKGRVVLQFKEPVAWLGMEPEDAIAMAQALIKRARAVATRPLRISIDP